MESLETLLIFNVNKIMQYINKNSLILTVKNTNTNIFCTLTNLKGIVLKSITVGSYKIKGVKKISTTSIISILKILYIYITKNYKSFQVYVKIRGLNKNKNEFIKNLKLCGINLIFIQDRFSLPHGGCRKRRKRKI